MAAYGFSGVLLISVILFRNSFVPHSLERITNLQVHIGPAVQMWALRWYCKGRCELWSGTEVTYMEIPDQMSVVPCVALYLLWVTVFVLDQFVIERKRIERLGFATLFSLMAHDMGILKALPTQLQSPIASRCVFVAGHFGLFVAGLPVMFFPFWPHTFMICFAVAWSFKNGASFYMTYFWKVYDEQINAFERQMKEMEAAEEAARAAQQASQESSKKNTIKADAQANGGHADIERVLTPGVDTDADADGSPDHGCTPLSRTSRVD